MSLVQWNPIREMDDLLSRFVRGTGHLPALTAEGAALNSWMPAVDVSENAKEYVLKAELPGIDKDAVKVSAHNGVLTIAGERKFEKEDKDEQHHRIERYFGSFSRSFSIPQDVEPDKIDAECKHGVVTVRLPKAEKKKSKVQHVAVH